MHQCFLNQQGGTYFEEGKLPKTAYVCSTDAADMVPPRIMHKHDDCLEIIFISQGKGIYLVGEHKYLTKRGDILILNSGVLHDESSAPGSLIKEYCCGVKNLRLRHLPENHLLLDGQPQMVPAGEDADCIEKILACMFRQANENTREAAEICNHFLVSLILIILQIYHRTVKVSPSYQETDEFQLYRSIKEYIDQHYMEDISLSLLAERFHMDLYYLSHLFKQATNYSPIHYLIRRRIGEAQTLLIHSKESVTSIAGRVGYGNANYFITSFTKIVGLTPAKFRKYWVASNSPFRSSQENEVFMEQSG